MFVGHAKLEFSGGALRAMIHEDFARYYRALFEHETFKTQKMSTPRYGVHITVYNPQFHYGITGSERFHEKEVCFFYDPRVIHCGGTFHTGYYLNVESPDIEEVRAALGIKNGGQLHISLFTNKHLVGALSILK